MNPTAQSYLNPSASNLATTSLVSFNDLIGLIYQGASDPSVWATAILPAIARYFNAPKCSLFTVQTPFENGGYEFCYGLSPAYLQMSDAFMEKDVWANAAIEQNLVLEGNVVMGHELVPQKQFFNSTIYRQFFVKEDIAHLMSGAVFGVDSYNVEPTSCSLFRSIHQAPFNEDERTQFKMVLSHMTRALGVLQRLQLAELSVAASLSALAQLPYGVLLLSETGAVHFANPQAHHLFEADYGLKLSTESTVHTFLVACCLDDQQSIRKAIKACVPSETSCYQAKSAGLVPIKNRQGECDLSLEFFPLGAQQHFALPPSGKHAVIVFIRQLASSPSILPKALQAKFGLTPAEAIVAISLLQHSNAQAVANALHKRTNTVKSQIKQIYAKLAVVSRTQFVRRMLESASS